MGIRLDQIINHHYYKKEPNNVNMGGYEYALGWELLEDFEEDRYTSGAIAADWEEIESYELEAAQEYCDND